LTALPEPQAQQRLTAMDHLLTIAEYAALGETEPGFTELVEGRLLMSPSPKPRHNIALGHLLLQLAPQLPAHLQAIQDVDIDLELVSPDEPGFSRRPDLIIVDRKAVQRVNEDDGMIRAGEVLVVVEIVSPGSKRTDYVTKHGEYADAGIPHYWIIDLTKPVSLVSCHRARDFGYQDSPAVTGSYSTTDPAELELHLDQLS
jgi:Uma2 family endonuclease